ncbi:MAG: hypothetical protein ACOCXM_09115 [Myxococcota bacterium]
MRVIGPLLLVACVSWAPGVARAQVDALCDGRPEPGPCAVTPLPGTPEDVTLDAPIRIRYTPGFFDTFAETSTAVEVFDATGQPVSGSTEVAASDLLLFRPDGGWQPDTRYDGRVFGEGGEIAFGFQTGDELDQRPPVMGPILSAEPAEDSEVPGLGPGSVRIDVTFEGATDDGPQGSVEYQVYVTRGADLAAPELRLRVRHQSAPLVAAVGLTGEETGSTVCIAIVAIDGVGKIDVSEERCFDPITGHFFEPLCSVVPHPRPNDVLGLLWPMALGLFWLRRRGGKVFGRRRSTSG